MIRVQDAVNELLPGDTLEVTATDPGVKNDIPAWCRINGHRVLDIREQGGEIIIRLEIGGG